MFIRMLLTAVGTTAVTAAPAAARSAEFDLRFTATQTTTWDTHDLLDDPCGGQTFGMTASGRQTLAVKTKTVRVVVARVRDSITGTVVTHMWPRAARRDTVAPFRVTADVDRRSSSKTEAVTADERQECAAAAPGATEAEPDCGTRRLHGRLQLVPGIQRTGRGLGVEALGPYMPGGFEDVVGEAYLNCALAGPSGLLPTGMTVVSARKLFGENPRLIAFDERRDVQQSGGTRSVTTTKWRMTLTRRGPVR